MLSKYGVKSIVRRGLETLWRSLPDGARVRPPALWVGKLVHRVSCKIQKRTPRAGYTRFLRNVPQLELLTLLARQKPQGARLRLALLGCSTGAEVYSALWFLRRHRPDLQIVTSASDVSREAVEHASRGVYRKGDREVSGLSAEMLRAIFEDEGDSLRVQAWIGANVDWSVRDARDPGLSAALGLQDIVIANNFLIHMEDAEAETSLRSIVRLLVPRGYLIVWGVDPLVKIWLARTLGLTPVLELLDEIHAADEAARRAWPLKYWGIEPLRKGSADGLLRYSSAFRAP